MRRRDEIRRAKQFEPAEANRADVVTVCSALDREDLGVPRAVVVPNGYERPAAESGRVDVGPEPVLCMVGNLAYGPNADAARWCATRILPLVRDRLPAATLLLVGATSADVEDLRSCPGVVVMGAVVDVGEALARADVSVAALRQGSGTRIKILEAFAHRIPVVATTIGAEGLDVRPGHHLLVADDEWSFARACVEALTDVDLRRRLALHGHTLWEQQYDWDVIRTRFADQVIRPLLPGSAAP